MKKILAIVSIPLIAFAFSGCSSLARSITDTVENTATNKIDDKASQETSAAMDTVLGNHSNSSSQNNAGGSATSVAGAPASAPTTIAAYQNYDFKPGENVIFDDNFASDQDGEFPAHWVFEKGAAVVNEVQSEPALLFTENWTTVNPRMTTESYLTDPFTIEFDYYLANDETPAPVIGLRDAADHGREFHFGTKIGVGFFEKSDPSSKELNSPSFFGKWHHAALIYQHGQIKGYIDNVRDVVIPDAEIVPIKLYVTSGHSDDKNPVTFKNFRVASGGSSNSIGNLLTNGKFVTHGITFDVNKATLRPESMGTLNDVAKYLKSDAASKFEIDGYTDNSGSASANLTLSQQRADAVKAQLVSMGVDGSRLTTKGFGETNPIAGNDTPEGKANNRRVEFVKQ